MTGVRPTKRSLTDLGLSFPSIDVPLHTMEHPLVQKAQRLPKDHASGGAERVLALADRLWFKVKVGEFRGAGGEVADCPESIPTLWWLVAGGVRRADSKTQDFYDRLEAECKRSAKDSPQTVNSIHLRPIDTDFRRYTLEQTALGVATLQRAVREAICHSAHSGKPESAETATQRLTAWVKTKDAETYLAIAADGFLDYKEIAILLDAVPGMTASDWQIEPGEVLGITPSAGQVVFSAMLPPESLVEILQKSARAGEYL